MISDKPTKLSARIGKFAIIGAILALCNFIIYTFLARIVFNNNELLWIDSIISCMLATILAYILHSKITWKERNPGRTGVIKFFIWNFFVALAVSPFCTWFFGLITPLYQFAHNISSAINLPFDYDFVESTGIFCLTTCVTMILNYFFYDKLVFGDSQLPAAPLANATATHSKVSIIVPIYNTAKYLSKCLDSILNQTYQNLEIILINDGSTDDSLKIIQKYAKKDSRIKVITQKNTGQSTARNTGLQKATGTYVSFIDSDDKVNSTFISELLAPFSNNTGLSICGIHYKRLKSHSVENVYTSPLRSRKSHESLKAYILYLLAIDGRMYSSVNKLYLTSIAKKCRFDKKLNFAEDTKFVLDYLVKLPKNRNKISFVLQPLYIYNFGTETSTIHTVSTSWHNWQISYKNLKSWLGSHPTISEKFWLHLIHLRWRISYLRSKRRAK